MPSFLLQILPGILILILTLLSLPLIHAQIGYDSEAAHFLCPSPDKHYCAAGSLQGSSIISCTGEGSVEVKSCGGFLSHILPPGYEDTATCYESTPNAGDAVCAFNGTGYTLSNLEISIPETRLCKDIFSSRFSSNYMGQIPRGGTGTAIGSILGPIRTGTPRTYLDKFPFPPPPTSVPSVTPSSFRDWDEDITGSTICSNPWVGMGDEKGDVLTLNIVLVVPTSGIRVGPSSSLVSATNVPVIGSGDGGSSTPVSMSTSSFAVSGTSTAGGSLSWDGGRVVETGLTSPGGRAELELALFIIVVLLVLQVCVCGIFF
ncbi:hypothetical protein BDV12DRAFT_195441 [Aspergillus spectabilis]